jgi:3'-phosphoadenosine 5'-phosphosulfate sulfotransferase (PAPS reductase)/FAD synthetase
VGYPLFNKSVANIINDIQRGVPYTSKPKPNSTTEKMLKEIKERYADFINSPLRINDKCCDELKKKPSHEFTKRTGKHPIIATLAVESQPRMGAYLRRGCNSFTGKNIKSTPLGIWSKKNILEFIASRNLQIADCYRAEISNGICKLHGCAQTGCMFCGFGKGMDFAYKILKAKFPAYYATLQQKAVGK